MPVAASRRDQILAEAARLFAQHGFHGVSIDGIGAAVGITGPALYRHFRSKENLLAEMLVAISEELLAGGRDLAERHDEPAVLLDALVGFHVDFTLRQPELITVHDRDLANLPADDRHRVRALQRAYVEVWVAALRRLRPGLDEPVARASAHAAFGLMNSTPRGAVDLAPEVAAPLLRTMARAALRG